MAGYLQTTVSTTDLTGFLRLPANPRRVAVFVLPQGGAVTNWQFGDTCTLQTGIEEIDAVNGRLITIGDFGSIVKGPISFQSPFFPHDITLIESLCD